jgi:P2 family phage contractile tail tube protein
MANLRDANILQDFTVWIDGIGKIGECPGFQPPDIKIQTEDFRGGGMDGTVSVPMGVEKIELEFDLHTWDSDIWRSLGYGPGSMDVPIVFRGYLLTPNGIERGVKIETFSLIHNIKIGKVEPGKKVEQSISATANYYKHTIDGEVVSEIDVFNKIMLINGVDKASNARQILGFTYFGTDQTPVNA